MPVSAPAPKVIAIPASISAPTYTKALEDAEFVHHVAELHSRKAVSSRFAMACARIPSRHLCGWRCRKIRVTSISSQSDWAAKTPSWLPPCEAAPGSETRQGASGAQWMVRPMYLPELSAWWGRAKSITSSKISNPFSILSAGPSLISSVKQSPYLMPTPSSWRNNPGSNPDPRMSSLR